MTSKIEWSEIKDLKQAESFVSSLDMQGRILVLKALNEKGLLETLNEKQESQKESVEIEKTDYDYIKETNDNVEPLRTYTVDFSDSGDFAEGDEVDNEIDLECNKWPGMLVDGKWVESSNSDDESYSVFLVYHNRNNIEIILDASYGWWKHLKSGFDFVTDVAQKHYLVNSTMAYYRNKHDNDRYPGNLDNPTFDEIKEMIRYYEDKEPKEEYKYREAKSRRKTMTLEDAKKLMDDLKIDVKFPSYS